MAAKTKRKGFAFKAVAVTFKLTRRSEAYLCLGSIFAHRYIYIISSNENAVNIKYHIFNVLRHKFDGNVFKDVL